MIVVIKSVKEGYDDDDDVNIQVLDCLDEVETYLSRMESARAETGTYYVFL